MAILKLSRKATEFAPGLPVQGKITPLPTVKEPEVWEVSAHPHKAERAGEHVDLRLGNPATGIAHSFVLPKGLPQPGGSSLAVPTSDHTLPYMDFTGTIPSGYGKGEVLKGRRTQAEVYHADPSDAPGTKLRFNLYEGAAPEEFAIRKDRAGKWFLHNKTQTRERRPDIPAEKPKYKEIDPNHVDAGNDRQAMMPKLDGAHAIIDLTAGRAPRVFSYRTAKRTDTGLIEHTHKAPELLKKKVDNSLDKTVLRGEILAVDKKGKPLDTELLGGMLNSKVWESRRKQQELGASLRVFPFDVVAHKGKDMSGEPFNVKRTILETVAKKLPELQPPELVTEPGAKVRLLNAVRSGEHPLTREGVVLVDKDGSNRPIKAKFAPDYDVFVRGVIPARKKGGGTHERAGAISYSWTPSGPVVGQLGGFKHEEAQDMLANPDRYVGRVARVKASKVFSKGDEMGALFQPRFKGWHLDKGDIEKEATYAALHDELLKIAASVQQLQQGYRRLGLIRAPKIKGPALQNLQRAMMTADQPFHIGVPQQALLGGGAATIPTQRLAKKLLPQVEKAHARTLEGMGVSKPIMQAIGEAREQARKNITQGLTRRPTVVTAKGRSGAQLVAPGASPEAKKALNISMGHHEGFERSALKRPKELSYGYGHVSPDVLAKEHNLLAKMTGPGSEEARQIMQSVRTQYGDAEALQNLLNERFGPRAAIQFGEGQKIPKAMRKALRRRHSREIWGRMPEQMYAGIPRD